jgi:hypothetical protein
VATVSAFHNQKAKCSMLNAESTLEFSLLPLALVSGLFLGQAVTRAHSGEKAKG